MDIDYIIEPVLMLLILFLLILDLIKRQKLKGKIIAESMKESNANLVLSLIILLILLFKLIGTIKKSRKLFFHNRHESEELVIKETWMISEETHKRSEYFIKNENGEWILDNFTGTSYYGFVDVKENPWHVQIERCQRSHRKSTWF